MDEVITIITTPETDAAAGPYTDGCNCRIAAAAKVQFPDAEHISVGPGSIVIDYHYYQFVDSKVVRDIFDSYETDDKGFMFRVRPGAKQIIVVAEYQRDVNVGGRR